MLCSDFGHKPQQGTSWMALTYCLYFLKVLQFVAEQDPASAEWQHLGWHSLFLCASDGQSLRYLLGYGSFKLSNDSVMCSHDNEELIYMF